MLSIRTILHPTDFTEGATTALAHALHVARHFDAEIHLLHVAPAFGDDPITHAFAAATDDDGFQAEIWADAERQLKALATAHADANVQLRRVLTRGTAAAPAILEYAENEGVDLIMMGTHGRRGLKHLLLGSVTEEVIHHATCHVVTVRGAAGGTPEPRPIQRLLVPVDFTARAGPLLQAARDLAGSYGAHIDLLHVVKPLPFSVSLSTPLTVQELVPGLHDQVCQRLETLYGATRGEDVPFAIHVADGSPAAAIVSYARDLPVDMILIAPNAMTGLERFFLGSVAERVVRGAACPVFVAKGASSEVLVTEEPAASAAE